MKYKNKCWNKLKEIKNVFFKVRNMRNKEKPLLRRKSDLPTQDSGVAKTLTNYKRADDYLKTTPDSNKC